MGYLARHRMPYGQLIWSLDIISLQYLMPYRQSFVSIVYDKLVTA